MIDIKLSCWFITPITEKIRQMTMYWNKICNDYPILKEWKLEWRKLFSLGGLTNYKTKTISISLFLLMGNTTKYEVQNTILHEISHVLTEGETKEHGKEWKECFIKLGGNGKRLCNMIVPSRFYSWRFTCRNKSCSKSKDRSYFLYLRKWKTRRCEKCKCFMKREKREILSEIIKNGYKL